MSYNSIYHHGIKGQSWGVRNGPPYPLDAEDHNSSEKKEGTSGWTKEAKKNTKSSKTNVSKETDNESKGFELTDSQKKAIKIGAIAAGVAVASVGGYMLYKNGYLDEAIQMVTKNPDVFANGSKNLLADQGVKLIPGASTQKGFKETIENTVHWANKNARGITQGRNHNCVSVAFATELRQRGYDVVAKENLGHYNISDVMKVFGKPERFKGVEVKELEKTLLSNGNGARGIIMGQYHDKSHGAHFFNWEIKNGAVHFFDGQQGRVYGNMNDFNFFGSPEDSLYDVTKTMFFRTDNKSFNTSALMNYIEPNDYKHFTFSDKTMLKWLEKGIPKSALTIEDLGNGDYREVVRRGYMYVQGYIK